MSGRPAPSRGGGKKDTKRSPKPRGPTDVHEPSPVRPPDKPTPDAPPDAEEKGEREANE